METRANPTLTHVVEKRDDATSSEKESGFVTPRETPVINDNLIDLSTPPRAKVSRADEISEGKAQYLRRCE
eukprot:9603448-Heterocapsa_arctica.AAC.2